jgi:hypothetical protein
MKSDYSQPIDLRGELVRALQEVDLTGFDFATEENDSQMTASFTTSKVRNVIADPGDKLVLGYTLVKDLKMNTQSVTRAEIVKSDTGVAMLITDLKTGDTLERLPFPAPEPHHDPDSETFETLQDCLDEFKCKETALQCEANRTCQDQYASTICCLQDGSCWDVHFVFRPTSLRCRFTEQTPDFEAVAYRKP